MTTDQQTRLDRLESAEAIRQLVSRYSDAVDRSDLEALGVLFVEDVKTVFAGPAGQAVVEVGREPLKRWFGATPAFGQPRAHMVGNHVIDFTGPDTATGVVYCQAFVRAAGTGDWTRTLLKYLDRYVRRDGRWMFHSRKPVVWHVAEVSLLPDADPMGDAQRASRRDA